ncbi:DUF6119 family protein [Cellulosimicrobium sp. ES-005]|uniref:DUF6119 family protein n=1 Tax=Cellulosimicrobium sp. ES-005 TaxID=3163031 RepID=A0AAU8G3E1_9MICO
MRVTLYLLRDETPLARSVLRRSDEYEEVPLSEPTDPDTHWELYTRQASSDPVSWLAPLHGILARGATIDLRGTSAGAVLLVGTVGRVFAVTFGTGFHAIDPRLVEPDFGLRVAANSVNPKKVTQAEARGLGRDSRNAVSSVPVPNEMFALRLVTDEEWIRRFAGQCFDPSFALSLNGADSLRMTIESENLQTLPSTLVRALERFESTDYRDHYPYFDNFRRLAPTDPRISTLETRLADELRTRPTDLGFAAPDELNFYTIDGFQIARGRRSVTLDDLAPESVFDALDTIEGWDDPLSKVWVSALLETGEWSARRPLKSYVVGDVLLDNDGSRERFVTTAGNWFHVAEDFAQQIDSLIAAIPDCTASLGLPEWNATWLKANIEGNYGEERYNRHAAATCGYVLLDRQLYHGSAGERVEISDLLTARRELVCVKRLDGSATMVHLFEQGAVSAALLQRTELYRARVLDELAKVSPTSDFGSTTDWTVIFAVATKKAGPLSETLPFFARASLIANAQDIRDRGYKVSLARIDMVEEEEDTGDTSE